MDINLDKLDDVTKKKYRQFSEQVNELLEYYKNNDENRYNLVANKIANTNGDWDTSINLISNGSIETINITQLLAYEYCLSSEKITKGKVSFEYELNKLFEGVQKFRIGNPVKGKDDECLYGKTIDDESAIPVTSDLYKVVSNAGAQHLDYFKNGELTSAVFIYEKEKLKGIVQDEKGNPEELSRDGINFTNLSDNKQSLLTNLRQTVFHEWTHNDEKEIIEQSDESIKHKYKSENGKEYMNYEKISEYVSSENIELKEEPTYVISTEKDSNGNRKKFFIDKNGNFDSLDKIRFGLEKRRVDEEICLSTGLTTIELMSDGNIKMHNMITEGFVEKVARERVKAIDPKVTDIDEYRYNEQVEIISKIIESRDEFVGEYGQTYADFIMHSSVIKKELEEKSVLLSDGNKTDGLQYISDYADKSRQKETRRGKLYERIKEIIEKREIILSIEQINVAALIIQKMNPSQEEKEILEHILKNANNDEVSEELITEFSEILKEEKVFFDGIASQLGYKEMSPEEKKIAFLKSRKIDTSLNVEAENQVCKEIGEYNKDNQENIDYVE